MFPKIIIGAFCFLFPTVAVLSWISSAEARLENAEVEVSAEEVAVAAQSDAGYCNPELKKILRRVLESCGLLGQGEGNRGCQPLEAKNVATVSGDDFNALFQPMKERGGIVQFDAAATELDIGDQQLIESIFSNQQGASYFFVVARASPDGSVSYNRELSRGRAESVMDYLQSRFQDPDLEREVGLLWLGEEFAQLDKEFCDWRRSGDEETCDATNINRGAFVAWIDCRL